MSAEPKVEVGQTWRNYRSGTHVTVVRIDRFTNVTRVVYQHRSGKRSSELIELFPSRYHLTAPAIEGPDHFP